MVNFRQLVESLLLEAYTAGVFFPEKFGAVIKKYNDNAKIPPNNLPTIDSDAEIKKFYDEVKGNSISVSTDNLYPYLDFLNIMCHLVQSVPLSGNKTDFNSFATEVNKLSELKISGVIDTTTTDIISKPPATHPKIGAYLKNLQTRGADALISEYGNNFVIVAVQQIVKKRIDFFTRLSKLKSPVTPFTNLIYDVFRYPLEYKSGAKKFTSDFKEVDGFYIRDLIDIALAARDFYGAEITGLKTEGTGVSPDSILETAISNNSNSIAGKIAFLSGQPMKYKKVDNAGKEIDPEIELENTNYTVNAIMRIKTTEAQKLVGLLSKFAEYERTKPGAGERLKYATQAASSIAGFGGAKLYG